MNLRTVGIFLVVMFVAMGCATEKARYPIMSALRSPSLLMESPPALLQVMKGQGCDDYSDLVVSYKHEALRRLMELQTERFGMSLNAGGKGVGIDHIVVELLRVSGDELTFLATPEMPVASRFLEEEYFNLEVLVFDSYGKLIRRRDATEGDLK